MPVASEGLSSMYPGSPMLSGYPGSPLFSTMHPGSPGLMPQPNPLFRPPIKCPQGTDLSNGGVLVSTGDYAAMQKAYRGKVQVSEHPLSQIATAHISFFGAYFGLYTSTILGPA